MAITKRKKLIVEKIDTMKSYELIEALELVQSLPKVKFNESVDISINLGVDPKKSDQNVRGSSSLPHGIGKTLKVAVFADGEDAAEAKKAGAEIVGFEDLIDSTPDNIPLDGMVKMDMSANKKWITHAESLVKYKPTVDAYEIEKKAIKQLVPNDCRLAMGNGIQVSRNKKGYLTLKQTTTEE